jgi:hypothetical protein
LALVGQVTQTETGPRRASHAAPGGTVSERETQHSGDLFLTESMEVVLEPGLRVEDEGSEESDSQADQGSKNRAARDDSRTLIQTAALIGDWSEVERHAEILGWALVVELARRADNDSEAADMVRRKVGIDPKTAWWPTWWGSLSEESAHAS